MTGWMLAFQPSQRQERMAKHTQRREEKNLVLEAICTVKVCKIVPGYLPGVCKKFLKHFFNVQRSHGLILLKMYTKFKPRQNEFVGLFRFAA